MMSSAIFDKTFYLATYPDIESGVKAGAFKSGREHFERFGLKEGRVLVSRLCDEQFYLQKNSDIAAALRAGAFKSGLDRFIQVGETEGQGLQPYILFGEAVGTR